MSGTKGLRKIQMGRETVAGTAVAATTAWWGNGVPQNDTETVFKEVDWGRLSPSLESYRPFKAASFPFEETEATFEQLLHIGEAGIKTVGSGASDGAGTGKIYAYVFPGASIPSIKTYTLEGGDNQQMEELEYCFVSDFTLAGAVKEAWKVSANWIGKQITKSTFTPAISYPTVETILFQRTKLFIDAAGGTIGTTNKANTLLKASLNYTTGLIPKFTGDDNLAFQFLQSITPEVELELTFEHDGTAVAEKDAAEAQTVRLIRLKAEGSNTATPGTAYSKKTMIIDVAGKWEKFDKIDEMDGNDIVSGVLKVGYDSTSALFGQLLLVAELTAVP